MNREYNSKKHRGKVLLFTLSFIGSSYIISGSLHGYKTINCTIENDIHLLNEGIPFSKYTKSLKIDMNNTEDISFISEYEYLQSIEINNSQYLTIEDINILNNSNIKTCYLFFDKDYVIDKISNKFDFSNFNINCDYILQFNDKQGNNEIDNIILCNYITNYISYDINILKYKYLDDKLNDVIKNIKLNNSNENFYDFIEIIDAVSNYLDYDYNVELDTTSSKKKVFDYNRYSLSSILFDNNQALCTNYADLFTILAIKDNISVKTKKGFYGNEGHCWNMVNVDGKDYYVDVTKIDLSNSLSDIIKRYLVNPNKENYNNVINNILIDINDSNYVLDKENNVSKYNLFGTKNSQIPSLLVDVILGYLVSLFIVRLIYYEKKDDKKLILNKK